MYSILKILLGLKLALILIIISAGAGLVIDNPDSADFQQGEEIYLLETTSPTLENFVPLNESQGIENPETVVPAHSNQKTNSLSELKITIEL